MRDGLVGKGGLVGTGGKQPMTASGGNLIGCFLNRSKRAPQCGVAPTEVAEALLDGPDCPVPAGTLVHYRSTSEQKAQITTIIYLVKEPVMLYNVLLLRWDYYALLAPTP